MIVTDANGARVLNVVSATATDIERLDASGGIWQFSAMTGAVRQSVIYPLYLGTACTGQKYSPGNATGAPGQLRWFGSDGNAYRFTPPPGATFVPLAADDSIVYIPNGGGCSAPVRWSQWNDDEGVWPIQTATAPSALSGPLTVSVQN